MGTDVLRGVFCNSLVQPPPLSRAELDVTELIDIEEPRSGATLPWWAFPFEQLLAVLVLNGGEGSAPSIMVLPQLLVLRPANSDPSAFVVNEIEGYRNTKALELLQSRLELVL
jgi:hypothetical protein